MKSLSNPRPDLLRGVFCRYGSSERGLPLVHVDLDFARPKGMGSGMLPVPGIHQVALSVANPEMDLAVLVDRSGSMTEMFNMGQVQYALETIFGYVATANTGFHLLFYDSEPTDAGYIESLPALSTAIDAHRPRVYESSPGAIHAHHPRGYAAYVRNAMCMAIERRRGKRGIDMIIITGGGFADEYDVQQYVVQTLLPQLTPKNPYAFRLHFVAVGEEGDEEFLRQLERAAWEQGGIYTVETRFCTLLQDSHVSILTHLGRAFLGPGTEMTIGEAAAIAGGQGTVVTRVGDLATDRWWDGAAAAVGFIPREAEIGIEVKAEHPPEVPLLIRYRDGADTVQGIRLDLPLPRITAQATVPRHGFHLPWRHATPEDEATREAAAAERAAE